VAGVKPLQVLGQIDSTPSKAWGTLITREGRSLRYHPSTPQTEWYSRNLSRLFTLNCPDSLHPVS